MLLSKLLPDWIGIDPSPLEKNLPVLAVGDKIGVYPI